MAATPSRSRSGFSRSGSGELTRQRSASLVSFNVEDLESDVEAGTTDGEKTSLVNGVGGSDEEASAHCDRICGHTPESQLTRERAELHTVRDLMMQ